MINAAWYYSCPNGSWCRSDRCNSWLFPSERPARRPTPPSEVTEKSRFFGETGCAFYLALLFAGIFLLDQSFLGHGDPVGRRPLIAVGPHGSGGPKSALAATSKEGSARVSAPVSRQPTDDTMAADSRSKRGGSASRDRRTRARLLHFRSTLPRGERRCTGRRAPPRCCFDPRSRAGSDDAQVVARRRGAVSIHAPARGATDVDQVGALRVGVSIHAPARRATGWAGAVVKSTVVSIHAPARGATLRNGLVGGGTGVSIHAPARGSTAVDAARAARCLFRSTLPRGERRRRDGADRGLGDVSIHAPARGATRRLRVLLADQQVSIHAPARGATSVCRSVRRCCPSFDPRSRAGSDYATRGSSTLHTSFDPRSRAGSDSGWFYTLQRKAQFAKPQRSRRIL